MLHRKAIGRTWRLSPEVVYWLYTVILLPFVVHGASVWLHKIRIRITTAKITILPRLMLKNNTNSSS